MCLFRADRKPTLLGESIAESRLTLRGIEVTWLRSSAEPTLVPWRTEQLVQFGQFLLPQFLREKKVYEVLITVDLTNLLLVGK